LRCTLAVGNDAVSEYAESASAGSDLVLHTKEGVSCAIDGYEKSVSSTKFCVKAWWRQRSACTKTVKRLLVVELEWRAAHGGGVRCKLEDAIDVAIGEAPALPDPQWRI
jgi:hypothetical protein